MNNIQMCEMLIKLNEWEFVDAFSVGGFEYMGFSGVSPNKLIIISSQKETVFDCENKSMSEIEIDIDDSYISDKGCLKPVVMLRMGQSEHR